MGMRSQSWTWLPCPCPDCPRPWLPHPRWDCPRLPCPRPDSATSGHRATASLDHRRFSIHTTLAPSPPHLLANSTSSAPLSDPDPPGSLLLLSTVAPTLLPHRCRPQFLPPSPPPRADATPNGGSGPHSLVGGSSRTTRSAAFLLPRNAVREDHMR